MSSRHASAVELTQPLLQRRSAEPPTGERRHLLLLRRRVWPSSRRSQARKFLPAMNSMASMWRLRGTLCGAGAHKYNDPGNAERIDCCALGSARLFPW